MNQEEVLNILKSGKLIFVNDKKNPGFIGVLSDNAAIEELNKIIPATGTDVSVVISESTRLYNYVRIIPDLAWDIIDYTEHPLIVSYPSGFNVPDSFLNSSQRVNVWVVKENEELFKFIKRLKKDLFYAPVSSETLDSFIHSAELVLDVKSNGKKFKKMIIELNGEVKFL